MAALVLLERHNLLGHAVLRDDKDLQEVTGVDVALGGRSECVLDDAKGLVQCEGPLVLLLVLESNLGVEERLDEVASRSRAVPFVLLVVSNRVVTVNCSLPVGVHTAKSVPHVEGEEATLVQDDREHVGKSVGVERVVVLVVEPGQTLLKRLDQVSRVGVHSTSGQNAVVREVEDLGCKA